MPPQRPAQERAYQTAKHIAAKLGETEAVPVSQVRRSVEILGEDQTLRCWSKHSPLSNREESCCQMEVGAAPQAGCFSG